MEGLVVGGEGGEMYISDGNRVNGCSTSFLRDEEEWKNMDAIIEPYYNSNFRNCFFFPQSEMYKFMGVCLFLMAAVAFDVTHARTHTYR